MLRSTLAVCLLALPAAVPVAARAQSQQAVQPAAHAAASAHKAPQSHTSGAPVSRNAHPNAAHAPASHTTAPGHTAAPAPAPSPAAVPAPTAPVEPPKGSNTGLPLPRFASLKTDEVNLRSGPGLRYPIEWVYKRRDLPVEIDREFEVWRLISDQEGVKGWVHSATLVGRRTFTIIGTEQVLRSAPQDTGDAVARLKPGVIGRLRSCEAKADWCQVQVGDYRGWLKRTAFWGTYPGEAIQ